MYKSCLLFSIFLSLSMYSYCQSMSEWDSVHYFDFWEGTWEGSWPEGDSTGKAINKLEWIAGGKVLQEQFEIISGASKGFEGTSISVYNPTSTVWKQAWADNQGGYYDFTGIFEGDRRIFQTEVRKQGDREIVQRMVFKEITPNQFTWDWEHSQDGGDTWSLSWRINYTRL